MRDTIIKLLELPRRVIRGEIAIEDCGHAGFYSPADSACRVCETRMECEWLFRNDEFAALSEKPLDTVMDAFDSAVLYVDAFVARAGHEATECGCELCSWIRQAQDLQAGKVESEVSVARIPE